MNAYPALITSGTVFAIVALVHLLRLWYRSEIVISGRVMPMWTSVAGFILPLLLSIWLFMIALGG